MITQILGLVAVISIIILIDLVEFRNKNMAGRAIVIYGMTLTFGLVISILLVIDKTPPSPAIYIEKAVNMILLR